VPNTIPEASFDWHLPCKTRKSEPMSNDSLSINGCQGLPCLRAEVVLSNRNKRKAYFAAVAQFSTWSEDKGLPGPARVELFYLAGYPAPCVPSMGRI
jgi:hypothetical protein